MPITYRSLAIRAFKLLDIATMSVCFGLSYIIAHWSTMPASSFLSIQVGIRHLIIFGALLLSWHIVFSVAGHLYESRRISTWYQEWIDLFKSTTLCTVCVLLVGYLFEPELGGKFLLLVFWGTSTAAMIFGRVVLRYSLALMRKNGMNQRFVVIIGSGARAQAFENIARRKKELGYSIVGFVDNEWKGRGAPDKGPLLGNLDDVPRILRDNVVDEVVIGLPMNVYYSQIIEVVRQCEIQGIIVRFLRDIFPVRSASLRLGMLDEMPVITMYSSPYEDPRMIIKRILDMVLSTALLVLCSPLFLVAAILIRRSSPGPVFFLQERVGYNKRKFQIVKFRTMVENAEQLLGSVEHLNETSGPTFKIKDDPRLTRIGKILRRTSIDELPQLVNVLMGDMSLVGPRPLPVRDYRGFDAEWQRKRFSMKPGLTCFWQVNGRSDVGFSKWMQMDIEYVENWSLWLDMKILLKTIPAVLSSKGAF